jgi:methionyl-tRNA formyltransferase
MTTNDRYVLASIKPWHVTAFEKNRAKLPGNWHWIKREQDLTMENLATAKPRYVFLLHWSTRVPSAIVDQFECVCFHMTDVPFGRGGSPLQNLILRGHTETKLTALRMTHDFDAGPVYIKRPLSLAGSAQQIFERCAELVFDMIAELVRTEPTPTPQIGTPVIFKRRNPAESELPRKGNPTTIYDFIRMLDAETYPHAFLDWGEFRLWLTGANLENDELTAKVSIKVRSKES